MRKLCLILALALFASACAEDHSSHAGHGGGGMKGGKEQLVTYRVVGEVEKINSADRTATVKHGDIKGYMRGMTMDFAVRDERLLAQLAAGDKIEFWLETGGERPAIVEAKKLE